MRRQLICVKEVDELFLGAEDFVLLGGDKEFVALVGIEEFLLNVVEKEEEGELLDVEENKLLLIEVSQCAPLQSIGV